MAGVIYQPERFMEDLEGESQMHNQIPIKFIDHAMRREIFKVLPKTTSIFDLKERVAEWKYMVPENVQLRYKDNLLKDDE